MILPNFYNRFFDCWECDERTPMVKGFTLPHEMSDEPGVVKILGVCGQCFAKYSKLYSDHQRHLGSL